MKRGIAIISLLVLASTLAMAQQKEFIVGYIPMGFNNPHFEHEKNGVVHGLQTDQGIKIKYQEMDGEWTQ